jgi:nucleoside-diphosphate-sugar epimerase
MTRVLVTGATGFVGGTLCELLPEAGSVVRAALRSDRSTPASIAERAVVGNIAAPSNLDAAFDGVELVIHAAARAHVLHDSPANKDLYTEINSRATMLLAEAAARAGVRRFVYLSSIKVNGEEAGDHAYTPDDVPSPEDAYGKSKLQGERHLFEVAARTGMQAAIVRPPLVYGPGVGANFRRLMRWVDRGWPLPLGGVHNRRSLVSVWNLCGLLIELLRNPAAAGKIWLVSDADDLSTPELIRRIGRALDRRVRLVPIPASVLLSIGRVLGREAEMARLCGSLAVDVSRTRSELGWSPAISIDEGLARTANWYRTACPRGRPHRAGRPPRPESKDRCTF